MNHFIDFIKEGLRAIFLPHRAFKKIGKDTMLPKYFPIFLVSWGPIFIFLNFLFAQRTLIFQWNHAYLTLFVTAVYSYLIWRIASYFFFIVAWWFGKNVTLKEIEYGSFYFWITWAIMPFFDLPHLLFGIPMAFIWGAGAHISWIYGFPALSFITYFLLRDLLGFTEQKERYGAIIFSIFLPFGARFGIEMIPQWIHYIIRYFFGVSVAPGFHYATLITVIATLLSLVVARGLIQKRKNVWKITSSVFAVQGIAFALWAIMLPSVVSFMRNSPLPPQFFTSSKQVEVAGGISRNSHSFTWTSSDLESGTITHGPQATSAWWSDEYADAVDIDFNPDIHTIKEIRVDVHLTANTDDDNPTVAPRMQGCARGANGTNYYCSNFENNVNGSTTVTFTINAGSIRTYGNGAVGAATSTDAWEALIGGFAQDDNDTLIHSQTIGSNDANTPTGDVIEFDIVTVSIDYYDNGELHIAVASSTSVTTTTSQADVLALNLASSSMPSSTYLVIWGAQVAGNDSAAESAVKLVRASSSQVTISDYQGEATAAAQDDFTDGNGYSGFWIGHLNGRERLEMYYRTINASDEAYLGTRFIYAIRIEPTLVEDEDYWTNGPQESATAVLSNVGTTYTTVTSTTNTYDASSSGDYLVFASMEVGIAGTINQQCSARIVIDGTAYNASDRDMEDVSDVHSYTFMREINIGSGSKTISLQGASESTSSCDYRRPRIYVIRSGALDNVASQTATSESSENLGNWTSKVTLAYTANQAEKTIVIGNSMVDSNSDTRPLNTEIFHFQEFQSHISDFGILNNAGADYWVSTIAHIQETTSTAAQTFIYRFRRADGSGSVDMKEASLVAFSQKLARHYEQSAYRWYENADSTAPGSVLADQDTAATAPAKGTPFRLKLAMHISSSTLSPGSQPFKLQLAERSGTCDTGFSGEAYADVEHDSGVIRFYDNPTPNDGDTTTGTPNPVHNGHSTNLQGYEERNTFTAVTNGSPGNDSIWDFALVDNSATAGTSYCFRIVKLDGTQLDAYSEIPEIEASGTAPSIGSVTLNNDSDIILTPATTTRIYASSTVSDSDGDIAYATSTFYRTGATSSCTHNDLNCIQIASSSCAFAGSTSTVSCYADVWYFAQATGNASSSFPSDSWRAAITVVDQTDLSNSTSSANNTVDVGLITAIDSATSSLDYSSVTAGTNTGTSTTRLGVINYGNSSTTIGVSGTNLTLSANSITVDNIEYASSTFTYGTDGQTLSGSATTISGWVIQGPPHEEAWATDQTLDKLYCCSAYYAGKGYFHLVGGVFASDGATSTSLYASISPTGTIGTLATTTPLPDVSRSGGFDRYGDFLYYVGGGNDSSIPTSTIYYSRVASDGTLGSWNLAGTLPTSTLRLTSFIYDNRLYYLGGLNPGDVTTTTVQYASINADGTLGSWTKTTDLPSENAALSGGDNITLYKNFVYLVSPGNVVATTTVHYATIEASGALSAWSTVTSLPESVINPSAFTDGGFIYSVAGAFATKSNYAPINEDGTLGEWSILSATYPATTIGPTVLTHNGRAYVGGGFSGIAVNDDKIYNLSLAGRDIHWGLNVPNSTPAGIYSGTVTLTSSFSP